jgi:ABC-type transporter Mla subunit MlaD
MNKLLANTAQLSESADRFSQTAEHLPDFISAERRQIVQALNTHQPGLISLAAQAEKALDVGKQMSDASDATLKSLQDVLRQLQARSSDPNIEPFRISDYTAAAAQINSAAQELTGLLQAFEQTLVPGKELVDYTLRQPLFLGLLLIGSACLMVLASVVVFWRLRKKFA